MSSQFSFQSSPIFVLGVFLVVFAIIGQVVFPKIASIILKEWYKKALLATFGIVLMGFSILWPIFRLPPPLIPPTPTPTATLAPPTDFSVTEMKLKSGKILQIGQPYPVAESPLTIIGTYTSQGSGTVWVFVQDDNGYYYLQKPQVQFGSTHEWAASNVITAVGTIKIEFVYVTPQEQQSFQGMIDAGADGFYPLPEGSIVLTEIPIRVIKG